MTDQERLEMAKDQLEIACENLVNQKNKYSESYKTAAFEVESCINALKIVEAKVLKSDNNFQITKK
jgi:hypothetical protein